MGSGSVVNDVLFIYDGFRQLQADYQAHGDAVNTASTSKVAYAYADGSANTARRTSITYPSGRVIDLYYGTSGGMDDVLDRMQAITEGGDTWASLAYLGLDTRVQLSYPQPGVTLSLIGATAGGDGGDRYVGLDRFGRLGFWTHIFRTTGLRG